jgi:hypothetical protein
MDAQKLKHLDSKIKELIASLNQFVAPSTPNELEELLGIIHGPGWTTLAEGLFVDGILEAMLSQTKALTSLKQVLLAGSRSVGSTTRRDDR